MKKLLLIGGCENSVHVKNYYKLIESYFDEVLIVTNSEIDFCSYKQLDFQIKNPLKMLQNIKKLRQIMKDYSPSIIHVHQANSFAFISAKANKKRFPLVLTTWGSDVLILPSKGFLYKYIVGYSLKTADYLTADASFMEKPIRKFSKKELRIANFGIDYEESELPEKKNYIYSNRLHKPLYRIDKIIEGFADFYSNNPDWKLIIGANGIETEKLALLAEKLLPKVAYQFIGFVNKEENVKRYLEAKIWLSNPESDGTAMSLLEAMSYGCIPVVSNLAANNEWINNNENGIVIQGSIAKSLEDAKHLSLKKVQQLNKVIIKTRATKKINKEKFISLYNKILNIND